MKTDGNGRKRTERTRTADSTHQGRVATSQVPHFGWNHKESLVVTINTPTILKFPSKVVSTVVKAPMVLTFPSRVESRLENNSPRS